MAALSQEVRPFLRQVKATPRRDLGVPAWDWEPGGAVVALSGMGGAAALRAGETLVRGLRPEILVSLGFAGALAPGLAVGALVLGEAFWHYNPGTLELAAIPSTSPPRPLAHLLRALHQAGLSAVSGSLVTTSRVIHKGSQGGPLSGLRQPVLDLETGVLAEVAAAHNLPFLSLRAITDAAAEEIPEFLPNVGGPEARVGARATLTWLAGDFRRAKDLLHLWRRSRRAAQALAAALKVIWPLLSDR
ncbi:MAG: hypothetical protein ACOZFS_03265 [Thermodesulfobacteriota bacterium]